MMSIHAGLASMMNIVNLASFGLVVVLGGISVAVSEQVSAMPLNPSVVVASNRDEPRYVSAMGGFSVVMPSSPEEVTQTNQVGEGTLDWTILATRTEEGTFGVAYTDIPLDLLALGQETIVESLKTQPLLADLDWQAIANRGEPVYLDNIPGREYLHLSEGRFSGVQFYLVNRRLYAVMATSPNLGEVDQFVNSFQVEDLWRPFVSELGNFSVDVTTTPIVTPQSIEYQGLSLIWQQFTIYNLMASEDTYQIAYVDLPASVSTDDPDALLSTVATTVLESLDASALSAMGTPIMLQGYPGREYLTTGQNGISYVMRFYLVNDRLYGVMAGSRSVHNLSQFLNSFRFR
jgi:hypothetical protein